MGKGQRNKNWLDEIVMELCGGDITKRSWIIWNVTFFEAIAWCRYNIKRRFEWMEIIGKAFGGDDEPEKKCRNSMACSICRKKCRQRVTEAELH